MWKLCTHSCNVKNGHILAMHGIWLRYLTWYGLLSIKYEKRVSKMQSFHLHLLSEICVMFIPFIFYHNSYICQCIVPRGVLWRTSTAARALSWLLQVPRDDVCHISNAFYALPIATHSKIRIWSMEFWSSVIIKFTL